MRIGLSGMVLAMPAALLLSPQRVFAGSCCGGGTAGALLMPKSAKWLFAASGDFEKYNGYFDRGGKYLSDPPNSDLRQYRLNGGVAVRLASRWQAALASGYVFNSNKYSGLVSNTNAPADSVASLTYETFDNIRCVWRVRKWQDAIPAVYLASQLTLPTGVSPYDNVQSSFDITGRGFYRLEGKAIVEKTIYPFTLALTMHYGTHFARPVNRDYGLYVEPYRKRLGDRFTGTAALSYTYFTESMSSLTISASYTYLYEADATINGYVDKTTGFERHLFGASLAWATPERDLVYSLSYNPALHEPGLQRNFPATHAFSLGVNYVIR
ncbi:MAG: hypothetical protein U1F16_08395 [Turneriella sp.]